jgi:cellulose synthase/poly-beta-1,6-N-acetylglucosamine synthase-like glycosyltransferase
MSEDLAMSLEVNKCGFRTFMSPLSCCAELNTITQRSFYLRFKRWNIGTATYFLQLLKNSKKLNLLSKIYWIFTIINLFLLPIFSCSIMIFHNILYYHYKNFYFNIYSMTFFLMPIGLYGIIMFISFFKCPRQWKIYLFFFFIYLWIYFIW